MPTTQNNVAPCLLLTATVQVKESMVFTARKDTKARLDDYKRALTLWLAHPDVQSIVFVENSGFDLSELASIAAKTPAKTVEFLSFVPPEFDGALGKGYGEMLCLQHCLDRSQLLAQTGRLVKVTGRYYLGNASTFLAWMNAHRDADILCDMLMNLTWADSRVFGSTADFLHVYLCPMLDQLNDTQGSSFENVLARAALYCVANGGVWAQPPFPLEVQGISGSQQRAWKVSLTEKLKLRARHALFVRFLNSKPK